MDLVKKYITEAEAHLVAKQRAQEMNLRSILIGAQYYQYYTKDNLNYRREDLPQIPLDEIDSLIIHFSSLVKVYKVRKPISELLPAQELLNHKKIQNKLDAASKQWINRAYVCSRDFRLVDGHHDYAQGLEVNPNQLVTIYVIKLPFKDLVRRIKQMKISYRKNMADKLIESLLK